MALSLYGPVTQLTGVGPKLKACLHKIGIRRVMDVLFHLPMRYQNKAVVTPISQLKAEQEAVVEGIIRHSHIRQGRQSVLTVTLDDHFTSLNLVFFHFSQHQAKAFTSGKKIRVFGQVKPGLHGWQMMHPEYELNPEHMLINAPINPNATLTAIYPSTAGITQKHWQDLQSQALTLLKLADKHPLITADVNSEDLLPLLTYLHHPNIDADVPALLQRSHALIEKLAFEELLAHQLSLLHLRHNKQNYQATPLTLDTKTQQKFMQQLGFALTSAQQRVFNDILTDFNQAHPMLRLIQGDVGSGKTVVAALAALAAVRSGFQVAILAPTEILAEQHLFSFQQWFKTLDIEVDWLISRHSKQHKQALLQRLQSSDENALSILIGTHAIFQDDVAFNKLGLVIIDEQHRFGVHQRLALRDKGLHIDATSHPEEPIVMAPHQLVMTATPIPRTLAMCAYADLDCSVIDELPAGRKAIQTVAMEQHRRAEVTERILHLCQQGQQVYWVCTLIHESESLDCQSANETFEFLQRALPELKIGLVHGQLNADKKSLIMQDFSSGELDVLVATTVIEVGVNVPNATLMVIENPERLGLAQLHQLRGRVGRGQLQSFCLLLYQKPLTEQGKERLKVMRESSDGFIIAEKDLQLRGPGELLGSQQSGITRFKIADLQLHEYLIEKVDKKAHQLMQDEEANHQLIQLLSERWIEAADDYVQA